jgi:hypothetical protein
MENIVKPWGLSLMAARDMYYAHSQLDVESRLIARRRTPGQKDDAHNERLETIPHGPNGDSEEIEVMVDAYLYQIRKNGYWQRFGQLFTEPRCKRASLSAATANN